jgi:Holliday junction resolvase RusA-like endonuclease
LRLSIAAIGRPAPQGSKQLGGAGQLLEQSAYLPAWRAAVKIAAFEEYRRLSISPKALPVFGAGVPVVIESCTFFVGPQQCRADNTDEPIGTPDIDKLLRAVLDALGGAKGNHSSARCFADDSQVVEIRGLRKVRATTQTGALIVISDGRD